MGTLTIQQKLIAFGAIGAALGIALGLNGYFNVASVSGSIRQMTMVSHAIRNQMQADMMHDALRADALAALVATTPDDRKVAEADAREHAASFRAALAANDELELDAAARDAVTAARSQVHAYCDAAEAFVAAVIANPEAARASLPAFLRQFSDAEERLEAMGDAVQGMAARIEDAAVSEARVGLQLAIWVGVIGLSTFVALGWYVTRSVALPLGGLANVLRDGSSRISHIAGQLAGASQSLAQGATEQAASLEETSAAMGTIASMTQRNAESTNLAEKLMADVDGQVHGSNQALADLTSSMESIHESSGRVANIIRTIDEIALQTNILALNATVEAARAGDAGVGFAVVADEVRNLARRSAQAARDTAALIDDSISKAAGGADRVRVMAVSIGSMTERVARLRDLIGQIGEASRQQSLDIGSVAQAMSQMEQVTQAAAASAEETAASTEELQAEAARTLAEVERLERMTGVRVARAADAPDADARLAVAGHATDRRAA